MTETHRRQLRLNQELETWVSFDEPGQQDRLIKVPLDRKFRHDLCAMADAVTEKTRLLFIANPNNPTGTIVRKPDVDRFLADLPRYVTVVLDEAYYEVAADQKDFPNSLEYIDRGFNVIGLRTFS